MSDAPQHQPVAECGLTAQPEAAPYHRQWLVANDSGQWLNRELCPRLAEVSVELRMGYLVLKAPGMLRMDIPLDVIEDDDSVRYSMRVGEQVIDVVDEGELAAAWISNFVQVPCRIMKVHPDTPVSAWPGEARASRHVLRPVCAACTQTGCVPAGRHQAPEGRTDSPETEARGGCQQRDQRGLAPRRIGHGGSHAAHDGAQQRQARQRGQQGGGQRLEEHGHGAGHDAQREVRQAVGGGGDVALGRIGMRLGAGADGGADRASVTLCAPKGAASSPRTPVAATRRDAGGR